ncbi:MAG: flagellar basal body L-ring protein FlgH [Hyphomonadaceae bacterium]
MRTLALLALAAGAAGCASVGSGARDFAEDAAAAPGMAYDAARRAVAAPALHPVSTPAPLTGGEQQTMPQPQPAAYEQGAPNSLWRSGSRSFFNDQRASRMGDILTVMIEIDDSAQVSNTSNRSRSGSTSSGFSNFFGLEDAVSSMLGTDTSNLVTAESDSTQRTGAINRAEKIELTVAAVIVDRLQRRIWFLLTSGSSHQRRSARETDGLASSAPKTSPTTSSTTPRSPKHAFYMTRQISGSAAPRLGPEAGRCADAVVRLQLTRASCASPIRLAQFAAEHFARRTARQRTIQETTALAVVGVDLARTR